MRIGICTFFNCQNYGALLQCFALQKALEELHHEAYVVDYTNIREKFPLRRRILQIGFWPLKALFQWKRTLKRLRFIKENMNLTNHYKSYRSLVAAPPAFDAFVAGSDQIWLPKNAGEDFFFLAFAPAGSKKIAYAASFGISKLPESWHELYRQKLGRFDAISVREPEGAEIIASLAGIKVPTVADPTLLLNPAKWYQTANENLCPKEKYVLIYHIRQDKRMVQKSFAVAKEFAAKNNCKILSVNLKEYIKAVGENIRSAAPDEFLGLVKNAELVVTDSFHGTVFSLIFHRKFLTLGDASCGSMKTSSRLENLLTIANMPHRFVDLEQRVNWQSIDSDERWDECDSNIASARAGSESVLVGMLEK